MTAFSPGLAQGCFHLLGLLGRQPLTIPDVLGAFSHLGSMPSGAVIEAAQTLNWVSVTTDGTLAATAGGERLLQLVGYEPMLQRALLDYVEALSPAWVQNATFGRHRVLAFVGAEIGQVFVEAGLASGTGNDIVAFWDTLAAIARGRKADRLLDIGRRGERLTLAHEEARTGRQPRWVSIDNNEDGYDVLSVAARDDHRLLSIEVKATTVGLAASLHLTRNEWERACEADCHVFHLWNLGAGAAVSLAVVPADLLRAHVARDSGEGAWQMVRVPFSAFADRFEVAA